jgi:hypothetical protein
MGNCQLFLKDKQLIFVTQLRKLREGYFLLAHVRRQGSKKLNSVLIID